jgi:hypothetical protein
MTTKQKVWIAGGILAIIVNAVLAIWIVPSLECRDETPEGKGKSANLERGKASDVSAAYTAECFARKLLAQLP